MNNQDKLSLANNISVSVIPYTKNGNIFEIIKSTPNSINIKLNGVNNQCAFHTKANDTKNSKIVAWFSNISTKETVMSGIKLLYTNKQPLKEDLINNILPKKCVYINNKFTAINRKIFWLSK